MCWDCVTRRNGQPEAERGAVLSMAIEGTVCTCPVEHNELSLTLPFTSWKIVLWRWEELCVHQKAVRAYLRAAIRDVRPPD